MRVHVEEKGGVEKQSGRRNISALLDRPSFLRSYPSVRDLASVTKQSVDYIYVCTVKPYDILKVTNASRYTICILLDYSTLEYQQLYYL
jgi:hypothetical protein